LLSWFKCLNLNFLFTVYKEVIASLLVKLQEIMVDNRQMLQSNVEADLKKKIESAQKVLGELRHAVHQVETNSAKV
jgi:hypothetical protein